MANFEAFRWNFSLSTNPEFRRSVVLVKDEWPYIVSKSPNSLLDDRVSKADHQLRDHPGFQKAVSEQEKRSVTHLVIASF